MWQPLDESLSLFSNYFFPLPLRLPFLPFPFAAACPAAGTLACTAGALACAAAPRFRPTRFIFTFRKLAWLQNTFSMAHDPRTHSISSRT